jgi:bis(5'-nucleosyl)-tetraphosphatase (symmetrical)
MDLLEKGPSKNAPPNMMPWYEVPNRQSNNVRIIFGHWAALIGKTNSDNNVIALDTGCVWGNYLSALRLEDNIKFSIKRIGS